MSLQMERKPDGTYDMWDNGKIVATGLTNAAAWRMIDREAGQPVSRQEAVSDWITNKLLSE